MVSWLPYVTSFCCCMGLDTGAKLVACLHTLTSLFLVTACSVYAVEFGRLQQTEESGGVYGTWYRLCIIIAVVCSAHLALASTLVVGVFRRKIGFLNFWIRVMVSLLVTAIVFVIALCLKYGLSETGSDMFVSMLQGVLYFGSVTYCILVVNSYYMKLKSTQDMEGPKSGY